MGGQDREQRADCVEATLVGAWGGSLGARRDGAAAGFGTAFRAAAAASGAHASGAAAAACGRAG